MKKIIPIFLLILFYVSPAFSLDLAAYASYWDAKDSKGAWGTGAKLGIPLFTDHLQIDARAYWYPETSDDTVGNIEFLPIDLGASFHIFTQSTWQFYAMAGASYIFVNSSSFTLNNTFGAYAGAGIEYKLISSLALATEVLVRMADFDFGNSFRDNTYDATGLTVNMGLRFRF